MEIRSRTGPSTAGQEATRPQFEFSAPSQVGPVVPTPRESAEDTAARLVVARGPEAGKQIVLAAERTTIGRDRNCELVIDDPTVSRFHAELYQWEGRYYLRDGDSLNGTYLNRRLVGEAGLADGDEIWVGKARFYFRAGW